MSLDPQTDYAIPEDTQRVARAAFPKGNLYMRMRDELGAIYKDASFVELFPGRGQKAESPGRLAWVTVMQFSEGLSDRQAAEAVRARIDWKYVLGLELDNPGFNYSVLSEFRERLLSGQKEQMLLDELLTRLRELKLLKGRGQQRTDSTHILGAVRQLNRLEIVGETLRQALNELSEFAPEWVKEIAKPEWFAHYGRRFEQMRLPKEQAERDALLVTIGEDGAFLLEAVRTAGESPAHSAEAEQMRELPGVEFLRRMWVQQYWTEVKEDGSAHLRIRNGDDNQPPGALRLHSPYDEEVRYSAKREKGWVGYKTQLSETSGKDEVHLIIQVTTTLATESDMTALENVHRTLQQKDLLPDEHLLDAGYVDAESLISAKRDFGVTLCSPVREKVSWQAKTAEGFDLVNFQIDWEKQVVICPKGQTSAQWCERHSENRKPTIQVRYSPTVCRACTFQVQCTKAKSGARTITFLHREQHQALQQVRKEQNTKAFWEKYAQRCGIEGTFSQAVRGYELRFARYIGLAKTNLQMLATATAINLHRLFDWWQHRPRAKTRTSAFAKLAPSPSLLAPAWGAA
jgi:transposase